ncbi:site-specific DNA-methyltransferase [Thermoanaerobacterium thermosaccharolyticum]|uniref:site-specific DNA-methyltransferase n=1 Tax=Thermoanaerobacterium thermosaccharolyticum TaxID=1517 RepID=UPI003DA7BD7D
MELKKISQEIYNPVSENVKKLAELFPAAVKDGQVDFEALKQELGQFEEVGKEKYELTWPGKTLAKQLSNLDIVGRTLKYVPEDSKNPETTENLYIEGDNLEVLKLLRNSYYGKIKMIYIDPPYNTGNDFVYKDDYSKLKEISDIEEGEVSEDGERLIKNQRSSARFHSNWLNMMYPRLKVAKDLLTDDGVIFISIDDNEVDNLRKICDEIFGEENLVGLFIRQSKIGGGSDSKYIVKEHDYILVYCKDIICLDEMFIEHDEEYLKRYKEKDKFGRYFWDTFARPGLKNPINYDIVAPDGTIINGDWIRSKERFQEDLKNGEIRFVKKDDGSWSIQFKQRLNERGKKARSLTTNFGGTIEGKQDINELFNSDKIFSYPKSVKLISNLIKLLNDSKMIILDFFSGLATTAHAVMQLNAEDGGNRKFIMVQLPEPCPEDSEAYKAGFKTIADIGKERIRRAGEKIKEEFKDKEGIENLDVGFKVFRVADTNIRWTSESIKTGQIRIEDNLSSDKDALDFNPGFTDIDVVYEIMLRHRDFPLTSKIEKLSHIGERTYIFADSVVVCLEEKVTNEVVDKIAEIEPKPLKVIFRDSAFDDDISLKINTMNRLDVQLKKHNQGKEISYRVEFI